jgi:hypothetical protein
MATPCNASKSSFKDPTHVLVVSVLSMSSDTRHRSNLSLLSAAPERTGGGTLPNVVNVPHVNLPRASNPKFRTLP